MSDGVPTGNWCDNTVLAGERVERYGWQDHVTPQQWVTRCHLCGWLSPAGDGVVVFAPVTETYDGAIVSVPVALCESCNVGPRGPALLKGSPTRLQRRRPGAPICDAPGVDGQHFHAESCPLLAASRQRAAWDLQWMANHPDEVGRYRALAPSERAEVRALGIVIPAGAVARSLVTLDDECAVVATIVVDGRAVAQLVVFPQ